MAIYTSDTNRVTGLSGVDTESMIDKMMKAESVKYERLQKDKILIEWRQEAYRQLISSMQSFQNKWFSTSNISNNIGYDAFWNNYKTSVTDSETGQPSNAITINSTTNSGRYDIEVIQKAETESFKGDTISTNITSDAQKMTDTINKYGDISLNFNLDGVTKEIKITKQDLESAGSIEEAFNSKLKDAFGTTVDGKAKVSVSNSGGTLTFKPEGEGHSLTISDGSGRTNGISFTTNNSLTDAKSFEITIDGYTAKVEFTEEDDTEDKKLAKIQQALSEAKKTGSDETKDLRSYVSITKDENNKLVITNNSKSSETKIDIKINGQSESATLNPTGSADLVGLTNATNNINLGTKLTDALGEGIFSGTDGEITLNFGGKDVIINDEDTIQSLINKVNSSGGNVNLEFNEVTNRFTLKSTQSGANGNIQINDPKTQEFITNNLKINMSRDESNTGYTAGKDAIFKVDGVETTRPSNEVSMNGINFTINSTGKVTIGSETDVDATMDKIKEFVEDYNKLVEEFNTAYTTSRPKSDKYSYYEPLTDEEKKGMSEDEIKKYEEQAKKGLLDGDDYIGRFLRDIRKNVYKQVDIGGKSISLYDIGISTSVNYNDGGKLEINESKLRTALEERGDEVRQLFTNKENGIAKSLEDNIDNAIGTKGYLRDKAGIEGTISADNNILSNEIKKVTESIIKERNRLADKEAYYFEMFGRMEAVINQQNSQMAVLLGMTG